jgi:hypothetical protein
MSIMGPPGQMTGEDKYGLLLCVFVSYLMISTRCTQEEATLKVAELCTIAQLGK